MRSGFNIGAKYEIIGRIQNGTTVSAYVCYDKIMKHNVIIEKGVLEQLALNKQVYNCKAQIYGELVNLKGIDCKLSKLPRYLEDGTLVQKDEEIKKGPADLLLIGKIQSGKSISHYVVITVGDNDNKMKIAKESVIKLAQDGRIVNAKVQMNNGELMLRGTYGVNLSKLALYNG